MKSLKAEWRALLDEGERAGLLRARLKVTTDRLTRIGVSPESGRLILSAAFDAARERLPWESVLTKIDEGILKRVDVEVLATAGRTRAESLRKAKAFVADAMGPPSSRERWALIAPSALALESGLSETVLVDVLRRGNGKPLNQVRPVIEAGEALQLAGFEPEAVEGIMEDCLARRLRRPEVLRVVRFATEKKLQGLTGMAIREALWSATGKRAKSPPLAESPNSPQSSETGARPTTPPN